MDYELPPLAPLSEEDAPLRVLLVALGSTRRRLADALSREWPATNVAAVVPLPAQQSQFADVIVIRSEDSVVDAESIAIPAVLLCPPGPALAASLARKALPFALLVPDPSAVEIRAAVRAVSAGLTVLDPSHSAGTFATPERDAENLLTDREREVLLLMAEGDPNKTIGRKLGVSEHTAKFHVGAILSKLGAQSRAEAVMMAARRGLVPL